RDPAQPHLSLRPRAALRAHRAPARGQGAGAGDHAGRAARALRAPVRDQGTRGPPRRGRGVTGEQAQLIALAAHGNAALAGDGEARRALTLDHHAFTMVISVAFVRAGAPVATT